MKHSNIDIFLQLLSWLDQGLACCLCTVTHTWGSSPRPQGSLMASNSRGERVGSLSGGCIEDALLEKLASEGLQQPAFLLYGESTEEAERLRLPCGGTVGVLLEPVTQDHYVHLREIAEALQGRRCITRQVDFSAAVYRLETGQAKSFGFTLHPQDGKPLLLRHSIGPRSQLFIIGASDVAQAVAELAQWMDVEVIVCDPRTELLQQWPLSGCVLLNMLPDEALQAYADNPQLVVVALTHDPRIDDMGLLQAFSSQACYIGAMGSRQTSARRRERLQALGIEPGQLARLHAPLGLAIGSKTPREIAIAFMAELVQHKHLS